MKLIISIDNIREFRPVAKDIPTDRIMPYIREAHQYELKRLLGDALYQDFLNRFDQTGDGMYTAYQALLVGSSYSYGTQTLQQPGLIPFMCYQTLARFYNNNQINATKYGLVQKSVDQSEPLDIKIVASAISELRSNALADQADLIKFLTTMGASYPLYCFQDGSVLGQNGAKFFDPDCRSGSARNGRTLTSW